jgi:Rrf2 family transcriptional regulator, cysteine metabolism repressor
MRFSHKSEYAILALLYITCHGEKGPVTVQTMAQELLIPKRFLEQIIHIFKKKGLVQSVRGAHGGYLMAKDPQEITIGEIVGVTEGPFQTWGCVNDQDNFFCSLQNVCAVRGIWQEIQAAMEQVLNSFNLKQMCDRTRDLKRRQEILRQAWSGVS